MWLRLKEVLSRQDPRFLSHSYEWEKWEKPSGVSSRDGLQSYRVSVALGCPAARVAFPSEGKLMLCWELTRPRACRLIRMQAFGLWFLARPGWSVSPPCNPSLFVCSAQRHAACGWGLALAGWCKAWHLCTVSANWGAVELLVYVCFKIWMELGDMPTASFPQHPWTPSILSLPGRNPFQQTWWCVECYSISSSG